MGVKGGVSGLAEDLRLRGGGRGKFSASRPAEGQVVVPGVATRTRYQEARGPVTPSLHRENGMDEFAWHCLFGDLGAKG